jgi:predicted nuclease of predicted toxin-antitoxin system
MGQKLKFYTDEHVSKAVARGLLQRGVDVLTVSEAGMLSASDEEHLAYAREKIRVMFTQDDDFLRLHAAGVQHTGIVYAHQGTSVGKIIQGLMLIYHVLETDDMENHIEYL